MNGESIEMPKKQVAEEALDLICGPRMEYYGPPSENLEDIASTWTPYVKRALELRGKLNGTDVCMLMVLLKAVRLVRGYHRDSVVDVAGYSELAEVLNEEEAYRSFVLHAASQIKNRKERRRFVLKFLLGGVKKEEK